MTTRTLHCDYRATSTQPVVTYRCKRLAGHPGKHQMIRVRDRRLGSDRDGRSTEKTPYHPGAAHATSEASIALMAPAWREPARLWLQNLEFRELSPATISLRLYHLRIVSLHETMPAPYDVTTADIMGYLSHYSTDHARPTVVSYQTTLKVFYAWATQRRHLDRSPMDDVPRLRDHAGRPRPVPEADYQAALDAASTPHLRMAVRLAGELGLRRAEAAQVHADDIVSADGGYLLKVVGKGSKPRVIPITSALAEELIALADGGWVFPGRASGHVTPHWMGTVISSLLPDGYSMHKLRHRALTQVYRDTNDLVLTAALAGHSSVTTTQTYYVEPDYTELRAAMERMASRGGAS